MGHEVAYHYEDLSAVCNNSQKSRGLSEKTCQAAYERFRANLAYLQEVLPCESNIDAWQPSFCH